MHIVINISNRLFHKNDGFFTFFLYSVPLEADFSTTFYV